MGVTFTGCFRLREMQLPEPPKIWQDKDVTSAPTPFDQLVASSTTATATTTQHLLPLLFSTFTPKPAVSHPHTEEQRMGGEGVTVVPYSGAVTERVEETSVDESGGDDVATGTRKQSRNSAKKTKYARDESVNRYLRPEAML